MQTVQILALAISLTLSSLAHGEPSIFHKGFAVGVYSGLEWISDPIPVNFSNPRFHQGLYKIRRAQTEKWMASLEEALKTVTDHELNRELDFSIRLLKKDLAKIDENKYPATVKCLLLNEALEAARERQLRFLVNSFDDIAVSPANQVDYVLQAEDLYGFFYGLQLLGGAQTLRIYELSDPFYLSFIDLWHLNHSFQSIRNVFLRRIAKMDPTLVRSSAVSLQNIATALHNPRLQELSAVVKKIESQWRAGNNKSLQFQQESPEYKAVVTQVKDMLRMSKDIQELLEDQMEVQRRNVRLSIKSCFDLLSRK